MYAAGGILEYHHQRQVVQHILRVHRVFMPHDAIFVALHEERVRKGAVENFLCKQSEGDFFASACF